MEVGKVPIDVLIYVALIEEFQYVVECLGIEIKALESEDVAITYYIGSIFSPNENREFTIALIPSGRMGNTRSSSIMSVFLEKLNPDNVVVLGIAGALDDDLNPGDILIPDSVIEYLANSAGVQTEGVQDEWEFRTSGNSFNSSTRLINRYQNLPNTQPAFYQKVRENIEANKSELISPEIIKSLKKQKININVKGKVIAGDDKILASGPTVGKGVSFAKWLRIHDRKAVAIEMETAGVYEAVFARVDSPRVIAIRGISDFADERKNRIEKIASTAFRKLAIKNCISLMVGSIEGGLYSMETMKHTVKIAKGNLFDPTDAELSPTILQILTTTNDRLAKNLKSVSRVLNNIDILWEDQYASVMDRLEQIRADMKIILGHQNAQQSANSYYKKLNAIDVQSKINSSIDILESNLHILLDNSDTTSDSYLKAKAGIKMSLDKIKTMLL